MKLLVTLVATIVIFGSANGQILANTCQDVNPRFCQGWERLGYCETNQFVKNYCPATCEAPECVGSLPNPNQGSGSSGSCSADSFSPASQQSFITGTNKFAWNMYLASRRNAGSGTNIFFSPASISLALGMVLAGARGQTRREITTATIEPGFQDSEINTALAWLMNELNRGPKQYELHTANAVYIQNDLQLLREYLRIVSDCFQSSAELKDFRNQADSIRQEINRWVEGQTNNKIRDLLAPGVVDAATQMVLVNAIYFKGDWLRPFTSENGAQTLDGRFRPYKDADFSSGVNVKMMNMKSTFLYSDQDSDFQVLGMPYKGNELTMFVFLPKQDRLDNLERSFSMQKMQRMMDATRETTVQVTMPKFKMTQELPLKEVLEALGMIQMFQNSADLSGMTGTRNLKISKAIHKAFIEVNEKGTEAAAATAFVLELTSAIMNPTPTFRADHPFIFAIRHDSTNSILFLGSLYDV